jgi:hypothetical protein
VSSIDPKQQSMPQSSARIPLTLHVALSPTPLPPPTKQEIDGIIGRHFAATLDEVTNKARQALSSNSELALSLSVVRETLLQTGSDLEVLTTWLKLKVPKIEDGGNFGVVRDS